MRTLNLAEKRVTKGTVKQIDAFLIYNRAELSRPVKTFYQEVKALVDLQARKPAGRRLTMVEILKTSYIIYD